ncbi:MAG: hypothetical protein ABF328_04925, partial [Akkermansiaceae bacterium]
ENHWSTLTLQADATDDEGSAKIDFQTVIFEYHRSNLARFIMNNHAMRKKQFSLPLSSRR